MTIKVLSWGANLFVGAVLFVGCASWFPENEVPRHVVLERLESTGRAPASASETSFVDRADAKLAGRGCRFLKPIVVRGSQREDAERINDRLEREARENGGNTVVSDYRVRNGEIAARLYLCGAARAPAADACEALRGTPAYDDCE